MPKPLVPPDVVRKILNDPDYVHLPRYKFSLKVLEEAFPEGAPPHVVAAGLGMTEDEEREDYDEAVAELRTGMGVVAE